MAVWTQVSLDDVNQWLGLRGLPFGHDLSAVEDGVEDSVYRVRLCDGTHRCLRLFERTEAQGPLSLATQLAACGLLTCPPIVDAQGEVLVALKGKQAALFPWIDGAWVEKPSPDQLAIIGAFMGHLARAGQQRCGDWRREDPRGWSWFESTALVMRRALPPHLLSEVEDEMEAHRGYWEAQDLPRGPIHADLFRNNALFRADGSLGAVIDWGFCASNGALVYDLAIVANDWCLADDGCTLDETKLDIVLRARENILPLCENERKVWPMALRLAALRFYLSRLHDRFLPREPDGKSLDPAPFHAVLCDRRARME